ncbi:MAG: type II toxin-antitoxin system RelE/ParE family toxin [SAR324 cluster bacterium]|nr:type II toxin-antitoxin system RelE/ParE family toxin [SAR324 cluster bacterium]
MIQTFKNQATDDIFNGIHSKEARKLCSRELWQVASRKLDQLDSVDRIDELRVPPGNRLEQLQADRAGQYSIRINQQYRICFEWAENGPEEVEITDYHS